MRLVGNIDGSQASDEMPALCALANVAGRLRRRAQRAAGKKKAPAWVLFWSIASRPDVATVNLRARADKDRH